MKRLVLLVLALICAMLIVGCNKGKDTELVGTGTSTQQSNTDSDEGSEVDTGATGTSGSGGTAGTNPTTGSVGSATGTTGAATGMAPTENSSIDESGAMVKHSEGKPAPAGRVWCENCKGHTPKEDAVESNGKSYCMACAEELKIKN